MDTIKQKGFQPGNFCPFNTLLFVMFCLAVEFLHSQFGKYLAPDRDDQGDLTEVMTGEYKLLNFLIGQISKVI